MKKILFICSLITLTLFTHCDKLDALVIDVSGNVSDDGTPVQGALVVLLSGTSIQDGFSLSSFGISNSDGNYTIIEPKEGKYYVVAIDDVNNNLKYDEGVDRLGFHGMNPAVLEITPTQITIKKEDIKDIDIVYLTTL